MGNQLNPALGDQYISIQGITGTDLKFGWIFYAAVDNSKQLLTKLSLELLQGSLGYELYPALKITGGLSNPFIYGYIIDSPR